jgi:outer membrane protein OmpA-like peptidoglycan-associated protein
MMIPKRSSFNQLGFILLFLNFSSAVIASQECDFATDLLFRAYHLQSQNRAISRQKILFAKSLQLCPDKPEVHNALASILEKQRHYTEAVYSYKQAIRYEKKFYRAWYGLGETYYKQKRFSLSLETHLHLCQINPASKARVMELLKSKRYSFTRRGDFIDQESLLVLYDDKRLKRLNKKVIDCGLSKEVQPTHSFINPDFGLGSSNLSPKLDRQLDDIALAIQQLKSPTITIHGHTDSRQFLSATAADSEKMNLKLSGERAEHFKTALVKRGISDESINIQAHGDKITIFPRFRAENRRVEIEVSSE